jgi:hypothetical protein
VIVGDFANLQPGYAEEAIADDALELLAFRQAVDAMFELAVKRAAALKALEDQRLAAATLDPAAPQPVKDYAAAMAAFPVIK